MWAALALTAMATFGTVMGPPVDNGFDQSIYDSAVGTFTYLDDQV